MIRTMTVRKVRTIVSRIIDRATVETLVMNVFTHWCPYKHIRTYKNATRMFFFLYRNESFDVRE